MVQFVHDDSEGVVLDGGEQFEWFTVRSGVKQGDVMSGFLIDNWLDN